MHAQAHYKMCTLEFGGHRNNCLVLSSQKSPGYFLWDGGGGGEKEKLKTGEHRHQTVTRTQASSPSLEGAGLSLQAAWASLTFPGDLRMGTTPRTAGDSTLFGVCH